MRIRRFNRLRMVVGIVAMLGAIVELPTAATAAVAMSTAPSAHTHTVAAVLGRFSATVTI